MSNQRRNPGSWITILFLCFQCGWGAESPVMQCPLLQGQPPRPLMLCLGKRVVDLTTVSTGSAWSRTLSAISATERNSDNTTRNTTQRKGNGNCDEYIHWFQAMCVETPFCCQWYRDSDSGPTPKENLHGNDNEQKRDAFLGDENSNAWSKNPSTFSGTETMRVWPMKERKKKLGGGGGGGGDRQCRWWLDGTASCQEKLKMTRWCLYTTTVFYEYATQRYVLRTSRDYFVQY